MASAFLAAVYSDNMVTSGKMVVSRLNSFLANLCTYAKSQEITKGPLHLGLSLTASHSISPSQPEVHFASPCITTASTHASNLIDGMSTHNTQ
uniref:Uncharacterized protein n=1 Tax=Oryza punctata TaxID=4537 RepID=A0A0E0LSN7_ORYPU